MRIPRPALPVLVLSSLSGFLTGVALPVVRESVMSSVGSRLISLEMLLVCLSTMTVSLFWDKVQGFIVRYYKTLKIVELVSLIPFYLPFLITWRPVTYFLVELFYYVLVSHLLFKGWQSVKLILLVDPQEVIDFDTAFDFFQSVSSMAGYLVALFCVLSIRLSLFMLFLSDVLAILGRLVFYKRYSV